MIASLEGVVAETQTDHLILRIGGVGLRVYAPAPVLDRLRPGDSVFLHTYLVVREDALTLYGFDDRVSQEFFQLLLGVNGVGPRIALAILSHLSVDAVRRAVIQEQPDLFARVPGVGKKTAQKILIHLQGKISSEGISAQAITLSDLDTELIAALTGLGYSVIEAQNAVQAIPKDTPPDIETRIRTALQYFSS